MPLILIVWIGLSLVCNFGDFNKKSKRCENECYEDEYKSHNCFLAISPRSNALKDYSRKERKKKNHWRRDKLSRKAAFLQT